MKNYLNFETDIRNLENELEKLKDPFNQEGLSEVDTKKISKTQEEIDEKLKNIYDNFSLQQQKAIELASSSSIARHTSLLVYENGKALKELLEDHNVTLRNTPNEYFLAYQKEATELLEEIAEENDFFAKVWQSQKDFAIIGLPYWSEVHTFSKRLDK